MMSKNMYQEIMKLKKKGYLKSEISRKLNIDPETVAKYYSMSEAEYRGYALEHMYRDKDFDRYRNEILDVYGRNGNRRLSMSAVYDYLEERRVREIGHMVTKKTSAGGMVRYSLFPRAIDSDLVYAEFAVRLFMEKIMVLIAAENIQVDYSGCEVKVKTLWV